MEPSIFNSASGRYFSDVAWGAAFPLIFDYSWRTYGDQGILRDNYPGVMAYVDYLLEYTNASTGILPADGFPGTAYGDWCAASNSTEGCPHVSNALNSYYLALSLDAVTRAAAALGDSASKSKYGKLAQQLRSSYAAAFFNESTATFSDPNLPSHSGRTREINVRPPLQTSQAIGLRLGVLTDPA